MNENEDLNQLTSLWYFITPYQRKMLVLRVRLYQAETALCLFILYLVFIISRLVVPFPRKVVTAHYL